MSKLDSAALKAAAATIRNGGEILPGGLLALLYVDSKADRCRINSELARAYLDSGRLEQAADFANRAWLLSDDDLGFLPVYLEIHTARGDLERIRDAHKQTGMRFAAAGQVPEALRHFNLHHYAYQSAGQGDRYDYDFDILNAIEHLARLHRRDQPQRAADETRTKTRVAYLVFGATHSESVLVKLLCYFAQHHDSGRFDVRFFVPENTATTRSFAVPYLQSNLQKLTAAGAVVEMPQAGDEPGNLADISGRMADFSPDLLVTTAALADYAHYFLACVCPAPVRIALVYGPPEQYVPPDFDWAITATKHPLIDSPCDGSLVPVEIDLPDPAAITVHPRSDFRIPADATLIVIVGRPEKLLLREYWKMLSGILQSNPQTFVLIVGIRDIPETCVEDIAPSVLPRLRLAGYRADYLRILAMADIVLDTFPSGGGIALIDAMALGAPVVTFRNDYSRKFDQTQWSPAEELFDVAALIVPRGDFSGFAAVVGKLIADPQHRREMGAQCRTSMLRLNGRPERMVRRCEEVYRDVLQMRRNKAPRAARQAINLAERPPPQTASLSPAGGGVPLWRRVLARGKRLLRDMLGKS